MSLTATVPVDVSATVSLRVPRGGSESLESGVADVLAAIDGVDAVTVDRLRGVRPTWSDIHVDAEVRLVASVSRDAEPAAAVESCLCDGFGVVSVLSLSVEDVDDGR